MTVETTTTTPQTPAEPRSRRQVLCGLMVALVAPGALIAACGTETDSGSTVDNPNTPGSSAGGASPTGGSAPAGGSALAALADIPDGGGVLADGPNGQVLLVRTGSAVKGFDPSCPHQGATVTAPQSGVITCPRHGSTFTSTDGAVTKGPAKTGLKEVAVKVDGANVVLA
ncbi:iron sulfur protein [Actinokineospora spheciospongiae]|uniref:Iron sulfur protein n=1 Tax=Actinokineospora spheciospongiae TaxID=909613 RepID=W7IZ30_9PSEU|nr:Rieske (2Fe-2S) protein [Actinokineospora spheciospongiae]EWC59299.1 iron sulfur protein [Actinokineospora spheciospongiae]